MAITDLRVSRNYPLGSDREGHLHIRQKHPAPGIITAAIMEIETNIR